MRSIFVSHVHEDNSNLENIKKWERKGLLNNEYTFTFETEDKRKDGYDVIKAYLRKKIEGAAIILILIGDNTHNHDWIRVEVELANNFHKKICCVRIPGTTGRRPSILNNYDEIVFHPDSILKAIKE